MRPHFFLDGALLLFFLMPLQPLNDFLRLLRDCFICGLLHSCQESLHGGTHIRLVLRLRLLNLFLCLGLPALIFQAGSGQLLLLGIVVVDLIKSPVDLFFYLTLQSALSALFDTVFFYSRRQNLLLDVAFYRPRNIFQLLMDLCILSGRNRCDLRRHILFDLLIDLWAEQILCFSNHDLLRQIHFPILVHMDGIHTVQLLCIRLFPLLVGGGQLLHDLPDNCGCSKHIADVAKQEVGHKPTADYFLAL